MKKRIMLIVLIILLGFLGFLSYRFVSSIVGKAINAKVSSILRRQFGGEFNDILDSKKNRGILKEEDEFLTDNLGDELVLAVDSLVKNSNRNYTKLEFSSFSEFILSYDNLVCNLVGDIKVESHYYSDLRCMMSVYSIGNIGVVAFADGSLYKVTIMGSCENVKGFIDEKDIKIEEVGDNITIFCGID